MKLLLAKFILLSSSLVTLATPPASSDYLAAMIACAEKDESLIDGAYSAYHILLASREPKPGELRLPFHLTQRRDETLLFDRAFYISPNVLRGFELLVPVTSMRNEEGVWVSTNSLVVEQQQTRQGITSLRLKTK